MAVPETTPVLALGALTVGDPAAGVPGSTATVIVWVVVRTPFETVMVIVSVVVVVAERRWVVVGVKVKAPVLGLLMATVPPPLLVAGAL